LQKELGKYPMAEAVRAAYQVGEDDETLEPRVLVDSKGKPIGRLKHGDYVIFYNLRGEREVELCESLLEEGFIHFPVEKNLHLNMVTMDHLMALFKLAKQESVENLYHHAMLGRRGERKESGARYLETIEKELENLHLGRIVSVIGRYWSLDREENWDRIEKTYRMLIYGEGQKVSIGP